MENMQRFRGQLEEVVDELFPSSPSKMRWVTLRDIGPCLCGGFIGAKWSNFVRPLPSGVGRMNVGQRGFRPHTQEDVLANASDEAVAVRCPKRTYARGAQQSQVTP